MICSQKQRKGRQEWSLGDSLLRNSFLRYTNGKVQVEYWERILQQIKIYESRQLP